MISKEGMMLPRYILVELYSLSRLIHIPFKLKFLTF